MDGEKVVVCSYLFNGGNAVGDKKEDTEWYTPLQFLQVVERENGKTRFFRTDFKELTCSNTIQLLALSPGRVGVLKDNDLSQFDAKDGKLIQQYRGPGYHLAYPAVTPTHFWTGNSSIPLSDNSVIDMSGHDLVSPPYNHRNAPANGMLYSPSRLDTVSSLRALGSALALTHRDQADFQSLPLDDKRRLLIQGKADWSEPAAGTWPTLRGNFERTGWLSGPAPVPTELAWEQRPASNVDEAAASLLQNGWKQDGFSPGLVSPPTADGKNLLVVQANEHRLICYDTESGKEKWTQRFNGRIRTAPVLTGNTAYLGCDDGTVSAIDLKDGKTVWQFFLAPGTDLILDHDQLTSLYPTPSAPVLLDGALYATAGRHSSLELGIVIWKLDPATGQPLGNAVLDQKWSGPDDRKPQPPSTNGKTKYSDSGSPIQTNDAMQVWENKLILGSISIDPKTMAIAGYESPETMQHIEPARSGIHGGIRWIRSPEHSHPFRLNGVTVRASHKFTSEGMILNRELNAFAMTRDKARICVLELV